VFDPARDAHVVLDGLSAVPLAARPGMWADEFVRPCPDGFGYVVRGNVNEMGHRAVTTPGILRVLSQAHGRFGRLSWAGLFDPAIALAEEGWAVRPHVAAMFNFDDSPNGRPPYPDKIALGEDGSRLYLRPDGRPKRIGERIRNPDLAATLRQQPCARSRTRAPKCFTRARWRAGSSMTCVRMAGFSPRRI
jgi:gamma-glutamyltranspeptidase/glutathione hydrolase